MTSLRETLPTDWQSIRTNKQLRAELLATCDRLRALGRADIAGRWERKIERMPRRRMTKEAINIVLLKAVFELEPLDR